MPTLEMEPTYRVVLPAAEQVAVLLVGAGGTGSTLALFLAGLAYHARQKGIKVELTLVDDDVVEMKNCGRQALSVQAAMAGDVYKVDDLALRLNAAYGLDIAAWPERYEAAMGAAWFHDGARGSARSHLIIGCVDTYSGRREMAKTVEASHHRIWALDCGNERDSGQVLIGNVTDIDRIKFDRLGLCSGLPSPYIQEPALLIPEEEAQPLSCAEMTLAEEQSLMINRLAATIAGQFVTEFVLRRQVTQMGADFNLAPTVMRPRLITVANVRRYSQTDHSDIEP